MQNQQDNFTHIQAFGVLDAVILLWQLHLQPVSVQQRPEQPGNSQNSHFEKTSQKM